MTIALADIARCFQGEIPSILATSSLAGVPNVAHLSQVFLIDDRHVATSNQFFTKSTVNLAENPHATLICIDPDTLASYKLLAHHDRSEHEGPHFEAARASIDAIASLTGMGDVFALRAIDIYEILDISLVPSRATASSP